jgi:hypothetical protein
MILYFPPKGSARSQVNQSNNFNWTKKIDQTLISWVELLHSTSTRAYPLSIATTNGKPPRDRINKDKQEGQSLCNYGVNPFL